MIVRCSNYQQLHRSLLSGWSHPTYPIRSVWSGSTPPCYKHTSGSASRRYNLPPPLLAVSHAICLSSVSTPSTTTDYSSSSSVLSAPVPLATDTADRQGDPALTPQPNNDQLSTTSISNPSPTSQPPASPTTTLQPPLDATFTTTSSAPLPPLPPTPEPRGGSWAETLRWRLFNARNRFRRSFTASRVRVLVQRIPFRFPSHPRSSSLLSLSDSIRAIFNPSLVSRMADLPFSHQLLLRWRRILHSLLPLGGASSGNKLQVYANGDDVFEAMWAAIQHAKESIRMETYILEPDVIGIRTMQLLADAAKRGVAVTLIYDSVGSSALLLDWTHISELANSGATVVQFNPILSWPWRRRLLFRNHRKILVVDERVGFTGGMNVGREYCGPRLGGNNAFRDTHVRVEGPAVLDLVSVFNDSYTEALPNAAVPVYKGKEGYRRLREERMAKLEGAINTRAKQLWRGARKSKPSLPPLSEPGLPSSQSAANVSPTASVTSVKAAEVISSAVSGTSASASPLSPSATSPSSSSPSILSPTSSSSSASVSSYWPAPPPTEKDPNLFVQVLKSNIWRQSRLIQRAMIITLQSARHTAYITTPYFIPPYRLRLALITAADRGVDVRLLTNGSTSDVPWSRWASIHIYHSLLRRGVRIYELQGRMLHAKAVCVDSLYASVGSFNFDRMSVLNLECNLTVLDPDVANVLEQQFFEDLQSSREVKLADLENRTVGERLLHWVCYQLAVLIA